MLDLRDPRELGELGGVCNRGGGGDSEGDTQYTDQQDNREGNTQCNALSSTLYNIQSNRDGNTQSKT